MVKISNPYGVSAFAAYTKNGKINRSQSILSSITGVKKRKPTSKSQLRLKKLKLVPKIEEKGDVKVVKKIKKKKDSKAGVIHENGHILRIKPEVVEEDVNTGSSELKYSLTKDKKLKKQSLLNSTRFHDVKVENAVNGNPVKALKLYKKKPQENNGITKKIQIKQEKTEAELLFNWLISPVNTKDFMTNYWEQKSLHIKRNSTKYYKHIFTTEVFDKILRENTLIYSKNIDVVSYIDGVKEVFNQEGKAIPAALWDYYSNGCSIRLLNPHTYHSKVHLLLATLQEYFGSMVGANVYLTPPNSQGFAPHFDDIEAFVLQLEGRKHWRLYNPKASEVLCRESSPNFTHQEIGKPFMEVTLNAGDLLYFPRGIIHEGFTDPDSHSLHITVSVYQKTSYIDLLERVIPEALQKAAQSDVKFRKGLPLDYLKHFGRINDSNNRQEMIETVENLVKTIVNYIDIDSGVDQLGRKFMYDSMPPLMSKEEARRSSKCDGPFLKEGTVYNKVTINLETKVRLLRYYSIRLVEENDEVKLYYNTENASVYHGDDEQYLLLEKSMIPVIEKLQLTFPNYVSIEELPIVEDDEKLQMISDLWEHGIVITEDNLPLLE